jgi:hypothetical protein
MVTMTMTGVNNDESRRICAVQQFKAENAGDFLNEVCQNVAIMWLIA